MAVITDAHHTARPAQTELHVQERYQGVFSLLEATLQTGRTHQIRVHCAYIQHPVAGDPQYGGIRKLPGNVLSGAQSRAIEQALAELNGQALHAYALSFFHPRTREPLSFEVPLPTPMQRLIDLLRAA